MHIWDLRVATPAVSYQVLEGHTGNISCLCYSASGLLVSQATWAPGRSLFAPRPSRVQATVRFTELRGVYLGIWLLGQDHPHLEAHNQQPSFPAQGTHHLGEEPRLFS